MSSDPLDRVRVALDEAVAERDTMQRQMTRAQTEAGQARRDLERERERTRRLLLTIEQLEQRVINAEQVADQSRQAMLDHAART